MEFPCGCSMGKTFDPDQVNLNCPEVWKLIGKGLTYGVFQLESDLGKQWVQKLKPTSIDHMAALGSILRPGCLKGKDEQGVSSTLHYCRRKNGEEEVVPIDPAIEDLLRESYQQIIYQEQQMFVAQRVAGFNLQEADELRKSIGKKKADLIAKSKIKFLEKSKALGLITEEKAHEIWNIIEKSARYSFNKSHALSYGLIGYYSAWLKTHLPLHFYAAWLRHSRDKADYQEEISNLVAEAKLFGIVVHPPNILDLRPNFYIKDGAIYFGLGNIRGIGEKSIPKIFDVIRKFKADKDHSWYNFLVNYADKIKKTGMNALVNSGALDKIGFKMDRAKMLFEYGQWDQLTDTKKKLIYPLKATSLIDALTQIENCKINAAVKSLIAILKNPPYNSIDSPSKLAAKELETLGCNLFYSGLDQYDTAESTATCKEFNDGKVSNGMLAVKLLSVREHVIKNGNSAGKKMVFLSIEDPSCAITNVVAFAEVYEKVKNIMYEGNFVLIHGERSNYNGGLVVKDMWELNFIGGSK